jgi:hypothetical protein
MTSDQIVTLALLHARVAVTTRSLPSESYGSDRAAVGTAGAGGSHQQHRDQAQAGPPVGGDAEGVVSEPRLGGRPDGQHAQA